MKIVTTNLNAFAHSSDRKFCDRLISTFAYASDKGTLAADVWGMQEVPTAALKQLQSLAWQLGFEMIMPENTWKPECHPKSIKNVILIKNAKDIVTCRLECELCNRYNYIKANMEETDYYILNIHAPQTEYFPGHTLDDGYVRWRRHLHKDMLRALKQEVEILIATGKNVIVLGDLNRTVKDPELEDLMQVGLCDLSSDQNTYFPADRKEAEAIDHILLSKNLLQEESSFTCTVYSDFAKLHQLSDHAMMSLDM